MIIKKVSKEQIVVKNFFQLITDKTTQYRWISEIALIIVGVAAVVYFWEGIDKYLGISQFQWKTIFADLWEKFADSWNKGWMKWATFISGVAAIGYFCEKTPYIREKIRKMREKIPKKTPDFEPPEGQVPLDSPFYVERPPIDSDCRKEISRENALIRIKAPRQMGKTSLMTRVLHHAETQGCRKVPVCFQQADSEIFADLNLFLLWFCETVTYELGLENRVETYWQSRSGKKVRASNYFREYLLTEIKEPLVLGLDEVDLIFQHENIANDFFALLRAWHERGKNEAAWKKLRMVIVHSQEVYIPLNISQSPFNVGFPVELPELTRAQANDLAKRHGMNLSPESLEYLMRLLGGHPYLLRVAFYDLGRRRISPKKLMKIAPTEQGPYADHLRRHLGNLRDNRNLEAAMKQVISSDRPVKIGEKETFKLRSMGLVKFQGDGNSVVPLCDLYRRYFGERFGN